MSIASSNRLARAAASTFLALTLAMPATSSAQPLSDDWKFAAVLYGYFPDIGGKTSYPPQTGGSPIDVNIDTIIDNLKFVFMGSFEARKGRWGVFADIVYLDVGGSNSSTRDFQVGNQPIPAGVTSNLTLDLKGTIGTIAGTYRVLATNDAVLDIIGGARVLSVEEKLNYQLIGDLGGLIVPGREGQQTAKDTNWDAIIGVKGRSSFGANREWFIPYYLDVGTGDSKSTWQAIAGLGYSFKWGDVIAAWRYIDYNMKSGSAIEDIDFNGPAIGVAFRW